MSKKSGPRRGRDRADRGAGDDEAELVDRIGGIGRQHDVAGRGDRLGEIGETFLRAQGDDHLAFRIERNPEAALIIAGLGFPKPGYSLRGGITMRARIAGDLGQLLDHMRRRGAIRIAHAEIDNVLAARPGGRLHRIHFGEDIRRQAADLVEIAGHAAPVACWPDDAKLSLVTVRMFPKFALVGRILAIKAVGINRSMGGGGRCERAGICAFRMIAEQGEHYKNIKGTD